MSTCWLAVISPDSASGFLKDVYEQVKSPGGQVDRVYQAQSLRPDTILGHDRLYRSALHFVQFYKVEPDEKVGIISVQCSQINESNTEVEVSYHYIGIREG